MQFTQKQFVDTKHTHQQIWWLKNKNLNSKKIKIPETFGTNSWGQKVFHCVKYGFMFMRIFKSNSPSTPLGGALGPFKALMCRTHYHYCTETFTFILYPSSILYLCQTPTYRICSSTTKIKGLDRRASTRVSRFNSMTHFLMLTCWTDTSSLLKPLCKGNATSLSVAQDKND